MPTSWETCEIVRIDREARSGLFGKTWCLHWEARKTTPSGLVTFAQSNEVEATNVLDKRYQEYIDKESNVYQQLITKLANEGWEPAATDQLGRITLMKRHSAQSEAQTAAGSIGLIQQLANLRDAGVLTEQEFQTKKAEILKRM